MKIAEETSALIKKYEGMGTELKSSVDLTAEYEIIWSDSRDEPNAPDIVRGIEMSIFAKKYKREPKKKSYVRKNHYLEKNPVYSAAFADDAPFSEKFFLRDGGYIVGAEYDIVSAALIGLTLCARDENGRPAEYRSVTVKNRSPVYRHALPVVENMVYLYENGVLSRAEYFDDLGLNDGIVTYDAQDEAALMNPANVSTYCFENVENGVPSAYSRISYSHGEADAAGPWKISAKTAALIKELFAG